MTTASIKNNKLISYELFDKFVASNVGHDKPATYKGRPLVFVDNGVILYSECEYCGRTELHGNCCAGCGAPVDRVQL